MTLFDEEEIVGTPDLIRMLTVRRRLASDGAAMEYFFTTYDCFNRPIKEEYRYGENNARESIYFYVDVGCPWKKTSSLQCEPSNG